MRSHRIAALREKQGIRGDNPATVLPMEIGRFHGRIWLGSRKRIAVAT